MRILITSVGTATAIGLIKAIKKIDGYYIIGTDINDYGFTAGSLLVDKFYKVPYAVDDSFVSTIDSIVKQNKIDLVIPINDAEILALSKHANEEKYIIPSKDIIERIQNKLICSQSVKNYGVLVPQFIDNSFAGKKIVRDFYGVGSKGIKIIEPTDKLIVGDKQFAQEFISGDEYTVDVLCDRAGNPSYIIPRRRLEVKSGVATKVFIEKNEALIDAVKRVLKAFLLPGFSNIQFIHSKIDDCYYFIEINFRFSGCGASSLLVAPNMITKFLDIAFNDAKSEDINDEVAWNSVVTRYYEELIYSCN